MFLLNICQETRQVGMDLGYKLMFSKGCFNRRGTWFNPELDILYLTPFYDTKNCLFQRSNFYDIKLVQKIAMHHMHLTDAIWHLCSLPSGSSSVGGSSFKVSIFLSWVMLTAWEVHKSWDQRWHQDQVDFLLFKEIIAYEIIERNPYLPRFGLQYPGCGYDGYHRGCIKNRVCLTIGDPVTGGENGSIAKQVWKYKQEISKWQRLNNASLPLPLPVFREAVVCRKGLKYPLYDYM